MADSTSRSTFSLPRFLSRESDSGLAEDEDDDLVNEYASSIENEEHLRSLIEKEIDRDRNRNRNLIQSHVEEWIKLARSEAIQWIINTRLILQLRFHTVYLSVTYLDRFLSKRHATMDKQWMIQLLAVACLSLAAKMKERKAWPLSAFRTQGYSFESSSIQRMEVLVLTTLDWSMHSITPFLFINCFNSLFFKESSNLSLITQIIFATIKDMDIMGHRSSTVAMAATLMVMDQKLTRESLEVKLKTTWVNQLFNHDDVYDCYSRMLELILKHDITFNLQNPSVSTKRKRLTFSEDDEKKLNQ